MNHLKRRPLEVRGTELAQIQPYYREFSFRLIDPAVATLAHAGLLGGRCCSVRGASAAQPRLYDRHGRVETLYQTTPYDTGRHGDLPDAGVGEAMRTIDVRGLSLDLWVERGLLFARVRE